MGITSVTMFDRPANPFWCVSANPAIDKRIRVSTLIPNRVNRAREVHAAPGGKAAHVAMVLRTLGRGPVVDRFGWVALQGRNYSMDCWLSGFECSL